MIYQFTNIESQQMPIQVLIPSLLLLVLASCSFKYGFDSIPIRYALGTQASKLYDQMDRIGLEIKEENQTFLVQGKPPESNYIVRINDLLGYTCVTATCKYVYARNTVHQFGRILTHRYYVYWAEDDGIIMAIKTNKYTWEWFQN